MISDHDVQQHLQMTDAMGRVKHVIEHVQTHLIAQDPPDFKFEQISSPERVKIKPRLGDDSPEAYVVYMTDEDGVEYTLTLELA